MADTYQPQHTGWKGWILLTALLMFFSGIVHIVYGIGGIFTHGWYIYTSNNAYIFDASTWGWSMFIVGILLMLSALSLAAGNLFGRIVGVILAIASIVFNIALIGATPIWSVIAIILSIIIIYAITAHGSEMKQYRRYHSKP